jgi:lipopolysaccharide biosynthesis glycosyltransferase
MNQIVICTAFDKNYQNWAAVCLNSILLNNKYKVKIRLIIISDITYDNCIVQLKTVLDKFDFTIDNSSNEFEGLPELGHVGLVTYWRLKLPSLLANYQIQRAIYLDVDTLILDDLSKLFNQKLSLYCGGCLDICSDIHVERMNLSQGFVINGGLLLMDVSKMNTINWIEGVRELNDRGRIKWVDQDALNILLDDKIELLSQQWNVQSGNFQNGYAGPVKVLHFTESNNTKPWTSNCRHPYFNIYRTYIRKTGFIWVYIKLEMSARFKKFVNTFLL